MSGRTLLLSAVLAMLAAAGGRAEVINYLDVAALGSLPQGVMDLVGRQRWLFTHASVGGNMVSGMTDLHLSSATRYPLHTTSVGYNSSLMRANAPPAAPTPGTVYECQRGNPGWQDKITIFENSVGAGGWHDGKVDLAMDKFCYIDPDANSATYLTRMSNLEAAWPGTVLVYATIPLTTDSGGDNVPRGQFNQAVRAYCVNNNKLLLDIADIESHDPSGNYYTFTSGGNTYERLYSGYTNDGGHLDDAAHLGRQQVAKGWYAAAAYVAGLWGPTWNGGGGQDNWSAAGNWNGVAPTWTTRISFGPLAAGGRTTNFNDFADDTRFDGIIFKVGAPAFELQGHAIELTGDVVNLSSQGQTLGLDVELVAGVDFDTSGATITAAHPLVGAGSLSKLGTGTLSLDAANLYAGGTTLIEGTLMVNHFDALPPHGRLTITGGKVILASNLGRAVELGGLEIAMASPPPAAVPEPSTLVLLGMVFVGLLWRIL